MGRNVCAGCHKDIAATQARTAMARTWQGTETKQLPANYSEAYAEGPDPAIDYLIRRKAQDFEYEVHFPGQPPLSFPVEVVMGGERHGLSFLFRVKDFEGSPLPRAPLVEGRYLHYAPEDRLERSAGFPPEKPTTYDLALGRVLTPSFEKKCLGCHGDPRVRGMHPESGVSCEDCHGPGQPHLLALTKKSADKGILNPGRLPRAEQMRSCSQCHAGFSLVQDAMPDDLLVSDQVTALSNSECWRQTEGQITCTNCHNPHQDAPRAVLVARSEKTCLECHSESVVKHAGLCPVNRSTGCVGCHMPDSKKSAPFVIADHWIRVHSEQSMPVGEHLEAWRSQVPPKHLYLRMITVDDAAKAAAIREQLFSGGSFFALARANSMDRTTAVNGGYLGDLKASELDPDWSAAALTLEPGQLSEVIKDGERYLVLQRMPRNFREDAETLFDKAMDLRKQDKRQESASELLEALKVYPAFLRALTYLGVTYGEAGNPQTGAGILSVATRLYPQDAGAHFNLGIADGAMGKEDEISEYQRTVEIDPDYVPAYLNWGAALYTKGRYAEAIGVYRRGINVDPLEASLHYSLSLALTRQNNTAEARAEMELAGKIDPKYKEQ